MVENGGMEPLRAVVPHNVSVRETQEVIQIWGFLRLSIYSTHDRRKVADESLSEGLRFLFFLQYIYIKNWGALKVREYHALVSNISLSHTSVVLCVPYIKTWQFAAVWEWRGVSIPDHNLVCGEKASRCGCWLFSRFQFRSGQWFSPQCKVQGIESRSFRILLSQQHTQKYMSRICIFRKEA